ncbi:MAG: hypothetical protein KQI35_14235 [Bacteroidetes bacterium]|nr:hypothetical protein [Bacteroidota bacterium]
MSEFVDVNSLHECLDSANTITVKLNLILEFNDQFIFRPLQELYPTPSSARSRYKQKLLSETYGDSIMDFFTNILIPKELYDKHFINPLYDPEYTIWFLKYYAEINADRLHYILRLDEKRKSKDATSLLQIHVDDFTKFEDHARDLENRRIIDRFSDNITNDHIKEVECLRVISDYYETHSLPEVHSVGNVAVDMYAKHVILKRRLLEEIKNTSQAKGREAITGNSDKSVVDEPNDYIRSTVDEYLEEYKNSGFNSEEDYWSLVDIYTQFFHREDLSNINIQPIFIRQGYKKKLAYALGEIYRSFRNEKLTYEYLLLAKRGISIFSDEEFEEKNLVKSNLYKYFTSKPAAI